MQIRHFTAEQVINPDISAYYRIHSTNNNVNSLHTHEYFELHFVIKGTLKHAFADGNCHEHATGTLLFIRPEDVHVCLSADGEECQYINLAFSRESVHELFEFIGYPFCSTRLLESYYPPTIRMTRSETQQFLHRFEKIAVLPIHESRNIKAQLRSLLAEAVIRYFTVYDYAESSDTPPWLAQLYEEMQKKENFIQGPKRMAELANISHHHLCRQFKKYYHVTPTDFLNNLRLNYAANMLAYSLHSVTDIALDLNFNNLSHFHHLFKKHYGSTPLKFRSDVNLRNIEIQTGSLDPS
jgi:AraC-type DNA-binding domain-containing proteins